MQAEEAAVAGRAAEQQGNAVMYARQNERDGSRREALPVQQLRAVREQQRVKALRACDPLTQECGPVGAGRGQIDRLQPMGRGGEHAFDDGAQGDAGDQVELHRLFTSNS